MKFSVITPLYNGMPKICRCIGSVKGQTLPSNNRRKSSSQIVVEHIIRDGGSTDNGLRFLEQYVSMVQKQSTAHYLFSFQSEHDTGMYDAINKGWAQARGEILSWLNHDEQYLPGTLEKVSDYFAKHPEADAVFGDTIIINALGDPFAARREIPLRKCYVTNGFLYALSSSTFYRRRLWDEGLLHLSTQYKYAADADLALRLLETGNRYGHIKDYLSLFGVEDGCNLSFHPEMKMEIQEIKFKHGAFRSNILQQAVICGRRAERVLRGCYIPKKVFYLYAENEKPEYTAKSSSSLGFRFTYNKFSREHGDIKEAQ